MATNMRLDVTAPLLGEELAARVAVVAMTEDELAAYRSGAVESYARSREEAGESAALARARSEESLAEMFPDGRPAPGHHLFSVREDGERAGVLWVCERWPAQAFVYDVEVDEAFRGRGLGAAAMVHAALWTRERGLAWLGLNVFGPNTHARALYERLGYLVEEEHFASTACPEICGRAPYSCALTDRICGGGCGTEGMLAEPLAQGGPGPVELSLPTRRSRRVGDRIGQKIRTASLLAASAR